MSVYRVKHRAFVPISIDRYIEKHIRSNPGESRKELRARLLECIEAARRGERCACGEPIWVIGSAVAGYACFTCITGEASPSDDYEVDEAIRRGAAQ